MLKKLITLALIFSVAQADDAAKSKKPKTRPPVDPNKKMGPKVHVPKKVNSNFPGAEPSREFCIKHFNTFEYMYTHTNDDGKKIVALTPKSEAVKDNLKWVWKRVTAPHNTMYGYLENGGRQLDVDGNIDAD